MIAAAWPSPVVQADGDAVEDLRFVIRLISDIRYRAEMNVPLSAKPVRMSARRAPAPRYGKPDVGAAPCRIGGVAEVETFDKGSARNMLNGMKLACRWLAFLILRPRRARLNKEIGAVSAEVRDFGKVGQPGFLQKPRRLWSRKTRATDEEGPGWQRWRQH